MAGRLFVVIRQACDYLDGPDGKTACVAIFVVVAIGLVVLDAYGRLERRRGR